MNRPFLILSLLIAILLTLHTNTTYAQFQTFPQTDRYSISGEKVKTNTTTRKKSKEARYLDNGSKKRKVKTSRKMVMGRSCSNFTMYKSQKATKRNRTLQRKRRKLS